MERKYIFYLSAIISTSFYFYFFPEGGETSADSHCIFRWLSGIPCPGCGTGRGIIFLLHGEVIHAWNMNPFSFVLLFAGGMIPLWIIYDYLKRKRTLESFLHKPWSRKVQVILFFLLGINWAWNIWKF